MSYASARARAEAPNPTAMHPASAAALQAQQSAPAGQQSIAPPAPVTRQDIARLRSILGRLTMPKDPRAWAYALRDREQAGERLTIAQRDAWRAVLRGDVEAP